MRKTFVEQNTFGPLDNQYKFNGKELDVEKQSILRTPIKNKLLVRKTGLYYYGARFYDPRFSFWYGVDPLAEKFPGFSPYNYCLNNPVMLVDPDGRSAKGANHIIVKETADGKYKVVGGVADNDRGIYLDDGKGGKGKRVGTMKTTHSFFDQNNDPVNGAILDPKSREGQDFVDKVIKDDPNLFEYMINATKNQKYDLKKRGIRNKNITQTPLQFIYRGSLDENGDFGSARDFGNFTAGMIAARSGFTWAESRAAFDMLQTLQEPTIIPILGKPVPSIVPSREPLTTIKAQLHGFLYGIQRFQRN